MRTPTIAVVECDSETVAHVSAALGTAGYKVWDFPSLADNFEILCASPPDALLVRLRFPNSQPQVDLVTALKLRADTAMLPVILTSADTSDLQLYHEHLRDSAVPAIWVLPMPIDDVELLQILAKATAGVAHDTY